MSPKKNILVIGASFVGTRMAAALASTSPNTHRVLLIEPHSHFFHLFTFPRIAVAGGFEHKAFIPFSGFFKAEGVSEEKGRVVRARVESVGEGRVVLDREVDVTGDGVKGKEIEYDFAVIATGTVLTPPGTLKEEEKVEGVEYFKKHQQRIIESNKIVLLGGGAVGVQMATDLKELYPQKQVTLVHSREHLMSRFHPKLSDIVVKRMNELGVELVLGDRAVIPAEGFPVGEGEFDVQLQSGRRVRADFAIITIGQTPNSSLLASLSPSSILPSKFIDVKPTLQIADPKYPHIFAVGDIANTGAGKAARPAMEQVRVTAANINRLIAGEGEALETYSYGPDAIHLTLGIKKNVIFRNPSTPGGEPQIVAEKDDGVLDLGVERRWAGMGASLNDFHA
ncbi:hypothetical protein M422DRAFT_35703 [Sphaerobolus stellatus SS14]|uniref:FAD/NAD(P)-binding domain-containing protein n=1 Tax=Sphaerobolus stellatus (strain SS14) TaxID=990650 RepID=A0A0C9TRM0_SPHS4|nr:hypothetical protein M422DRAFT_35703 [Sphaerobolus stellatus SS14]